MIEGELQRDNRTQLTKKETPRPLGRLKRTLSIDKIIKRNTAPKAVETTVKTQKRHLSVTLAERKANLEEVALVDLPEPTNRPGKTEPEENGTTIQITTETAPTTEKHSK